MKLSFLGQKCTGSKMCRVKNVPGQKCVGSKMCRVKNVPGQKWAGQKCAGSKMSGSKMRYNLYNERKLIFNETIYHILTSICVEKSF